MTKFNEEIQMKRDEQANTKKSWWLPVGIIGVVLGGLWFSLSGFITYLFPEDPPTPVTIDWETETETDTAGFNLYRAVAQEGGGCVDGDPAESDYIQINNQLIHSEGTATSGARYAYRDASIESGVDYCYQLEDVGLSGVSTKHRPIKPYTPALYMILAPLFLMGSGLYLLYKATR